MDGLVDKILEYALAEKLSDIHITKTADKISMTARGPKGLYKLSDTVPESLLTYLMYLAKLDISFKSRPQTGVFDYYQQYRKFTIRVAMMQSFDNLSIVLRLLNQYHFKELSDLTKDETAIIKLKAILELQYGIVAISGPTGSGKTTTAYTLLNKFTNKAVYTVEDPIEVYFDDLVQIQVNEQLNFSFEQGIKQVLRHDPDVIFIGEIRDEQSAKMAIRCALSGHLVLATIHSASCQSSLNRFLDFTVNRDDLKEVIKVIVNQRLYFQEDKQQFTATYSFLEAETISTLL